MKLKKILFIILFTIFLIIIFLTSATTNVQAVAYIEVINNNDTTKTVIARNIESKMGVGAFIIFLIYNDSIKITNITGISPFIVTYNSLNTGIIKVVGFHGNIPGPTGDVPLIKFKVEGEGEIKVIVGELVDPNDNEIIVESSQKVEFNNKLLKDTSQKPIITPTIIPSFQPDQIKNAVITPNPDFLENISKSRETQEIYEKETNKQEFNRSLSVNTESRTSVKTTLKESKKDLKKLENKSENKSLFNSRKIPLGPEVVIGGLVVGLLFRNKLKNNKK